MRYALFTFTGDGLPVGFRLQEEGHDVVVGMVEDPADIVPDGASVPAEDASSRERRLSLYDGMLAKKPARALAAELSERRSLDDTFVLFDRNHLFKLATGLVSLDLAGNFPTEEDYRFEHDREEAKRFVRRHYPSLAVADVRQFASIAEAGAFLERTDELWVLKGTSDGAATFVPDVDDVALAAKQILQQLGSNPEAYERTGFILEPLISSVVELTPQRMFYDGEPVATTLDVENKPFGSGNVSVQTGCAQDLVFPIAESSRICEIAFPPMVRELAAKRKGLFYWDASLLIDRRTRKIHFGEFCSNRPGFNSLFSELAQCRSAHDYFSAAVQKRNPLTLGTLGCSVTLFNPAVERDGTHPPPSVPIEYKKHVADNLWLWDVKRERGRLVSAGDDSNLAVITGTGASIEAAVAQMYRAVDDFSFVGVYYRPKFDYLSMDYPTSIVNRLNYGLERGLYQLPFKVKVGDLA
ncbi:MAG TPA: hypothetical protein VFB67_12385 [Candidatus Polarisedimenticolaceae bacterium]|nr:hypothetical protein [Candidatus Polarisedimenticolaceae bacterium]